MSASARALTLDCPQCGGENRPRSGERIFACVFCSAALFVDRSQVVSFYRLPATVDRNAAEAALRRWMAGNRTVKGLDREARVEELEQIAFPLWMFRVRGPRGDQVFVEPAAPTPIPQIADLTIPAGRLEPYRAVEEAGSGVDVAVPLETARGWLEQRGELEIEETSLVRVPLWSAGYRFRGASYRAIVDGATGEVLAAVYPEKAESPYVGVAVLGMVLFVVEGLLIENPIVKLLVYALTALPLFGLGYLVVRKV